MKKYLTSAAAIAIAVGCASMARAADDVTVNGITFYGVIDVGASYQTHGAPPAPTGSVGVPYLIQSYGNKSTWAAEQSGMAQSRIGIKGAEDMGNGWTGLFKLETGINPTSGNITDGLKTIAQNNGVALASRSTVADSSQAGQAFTRAAYVGVSNDKWGTLTAGRQNTLQQDAIAVYDPLYTSYAFSLIGFSGTVAGSGSTEDARWDNSFKYLGAYGPARLALMYQPGGSITRNDTGFGADVGFDYAGLSADAVYTHKKDEVSAGVLSTAQVASAALLGLNSQNSFSATVSDNDSYSIMARYNWKPFSFYVGYDYIKYMNPKSPLAVGFIDIGGYTAAAVNDTAYTNNKILQYVWVGARFNVTDKLEVDGAWYHIDQNSYATGANAGCNSTKASSCSGEENVASLLADYHFTKRFDVYGGVMYSQVINGMANGFLHNQNIAPTAGMRYSF